MIYVPSPRPHPERLAPLEYAGHFEQRRVSATGSIAWRAAKIWVSEVLAGQQLGCEEIAEAEWAVYFGPVRIGTLDERLGRLQPYVRPRPERGAPPNC